MTGPNMQQNYPATLPVKPSNGRASHRFALPANGLQKAAPVIAVLGLGTPVYWLALHGLTGHGWMTFIYQIFAAVLVFASQILLLIPVIMRYRMTDPRAGGRISTPLMLVAIILHSINGLFVEDAGDGPGEHYPAWVERELGISTQVTLYLWVGLTVSWLIVQLAAIIFAFIESSRSRLQQQSRAFAGQTSP